MVFQPQQNNGTLTTELSTGAERISLVHPPKKSWFRGWVLKLPLADDVCNFKRFHSWDSNHQITGKKIVEYHWIKLINDGWLMISSDYTTQWCPIVS